MIAQEDYLGIHKLHALGYTITQIARELGLDRKTVRSHLTRGQPPRYQRGFRPSKLDPYRDWIRTRLAAAPLTAKRVLRELRPLGYTGSYTILKDCIRQIRPKPPVPIVVRFETPPGDQAQADFARFEVTWAATGVTQVVWLFLVTLGYSRLLTGTWSLHGDLVAVLQGHVAAFTAFGGAPRRMLYDRMKTVVSDHDAQGRPVFHPALVSLAAHYGFTPEACRPYRAQTKGKIERPVGYSRADFWLDRVFWDLADLTAQWQDWLATVAHVRVHATTGVRPLDRWRAEPLQPLPPAPPAPLLTIERQLSRDGFVAVRGSRYAVPLPDHRSPIEVRIRALTCELYVGSSWLATYALAATRGSGCTAPLALAPSAQWPAVPRPTVAPAPLPVRLAARAWLTHDVERRDLAVYETVGGGR